jgi:hypothetical protein
MKYIILLILIIFIYILYINIYYSEKYDSPSILNNKHIYTAVIIEPRRHKALEFVLNNFTSMLDERWTFIIFHGNNNEDYVKDIINTKLSDNIDRIKLINLNVDNLKTGAEYSSVLYNPSFYDNIKTELFLIFQTDSMICSNYKNNIYNFLDYDYVGSPWNHSVNGRYVGNGGLSLRRKSKMLEIINKFSDKINGVNEDVFFASMFNDIIDIKIPSIEDAKKFGIEGIYNNISFGLHRTWLYHDSDTLQKINNFCPGFYTLIELNK